MIALKTLQKWGSFEDDCAENTAKTWIFDDDCTENCKNREFEDDCTENTEKTGFFEDKCTKIKGERTWAIAI